MKLRQILFNLVGNAIKFTETGFVEVRASFVRDDGPEAGTFKLEVEDTGCGIGLCGDCGRRKGDGQRHARHRLRRRWRGRGFLTTRLRLRGFDETAAHWDNGRPVRSI